MKPAEKRAETDDKRNIPEFGRCTQELLFGKGSALINDKRARTAQTPGALAHYAWLPISWQKIPALSVCG